MGLTVDREKEKDYIIVLLQYDFLVGEIEEETDIFLTIISILLSIIVVVVSSYLCYYGLILPQFRNLKSKLNKAD